MNGWLIGLAINYILTQLAKLSGTVDWGKMTTDILAKVNGLLPDFLEPFVDPIIVGAVGAVAMALADTADLKVITDDLRAGDWNKALTDLQAFLQKVIHPSASTVAWACGHCAVSNAPGATAKTLAAKDADPEPTA